MNKGNGIKSIEGAALDKRNGNFILYLSYQNMNGKWVISRMNASKPSHFNFSDASKIQVKFDDYTHFKDPLVVGDRLIFYAASEYFLKSTNLAIELPISEKIKPTEISIGNKTHQGGRINDIVTVEGVQFVFFDKKQNIFFTGEEKGRLGILKSQNRVKPIKNIVLESERSTKSLRYIKALKKSDWVRIYYESAQENRSHSLSTSKLLNSKLLNLTQQNSSNP